MTNDSAMYGTADPSDGTSLDLSVRCLLASCGSQGGSASAPSTSAFTATSDSAGGGSAGDEPSINPLETTSAMVHYRLEAQNASNQPITALTVGQDFQLVAFVQDARMPTPTPAGVFAGFLDVSYNDVASIDPGATITYGSFFTLTPSGDLSTAGQIVGAGASGSSLTAPGNAEQLLWKIPAHADSAGNLTFTSSFDMQAGHDTLLYGINNPILEGDIQFDTLNLSVFDAAIPTVSISNRTAAEGTSAVTNTPFVFTVSLSNATASPVMVNYQTVEGSATAGSDYTAQSGTLTFSPGVTQQLVTILVTADSLDEADEETFSVSLSNPTGATLGTPSTGLGTIVDDDAPPVISVGSVSLPEGDAGTTNFVFTVSLSAASGKSITVQFQTSDGSATTGNNDYQAANGTLTFAPGITTQLVTVAVNGDTTKEPNETFTLDLASPTNATLSAAPDQGVGTIVNDDGPHISFTTPQVSHPEGNTGTTQFVFTVTIGTTDSEPVTVAYTTQNGTATIADNDYVPTSGTLTFAPDTLTQNITVLVNGDLVSEANETFLVVLSNPANATISQNTATGVIENDDAVLLGFANNDVAQLEGNAGTSPMFFTVTLTGATQQTVTVQYDLLPGTATTPADYVNASGTLTFAPGVTSQIITVSIVGDLLSEADETFTVRLFNSTNAANALSLTAPVTATGTIEDDDIVPSLTLENVTHPEGNSGTTEFVFTFTLSAASGQTILVAYATGDDTATVADNDYQPTSGTMTFLPGQTSQTVTVLVNGDTKFEPTELFSVNLAPIGNTVEVSSPTAIGAIANDDLGPTLSIGNVSQAEGNSGTTPFLFTVTLTNSTGNTVTVNYATAPGTAATGVDFIGQSGSLTFESGVTQLVITVEVNGDTLNEADETFSVNLSSPTGAVLGGQTVGTGTILNDDAQPSLSIGNVSHLEGDSGLTPFVFVVNLSTLSGQTVTVVYATADGTATTANNDYQAASGTLTFGPGVTTQNITVNVVGDLLQEPNETFLVNLSGAVNATLSNTQGVGTIQTETSDNVVSTPSSLSGYAFIDVNGNGMRDALERPLPGVLVTLSGTSSLSGAAVSRQTTSAANGAYSFTNLDPGSYTVTFAQPTDYLPATVAIGSQGGQLLTNAIGFSSTIANPGGIAGVENRLMVRGLQPQAISQREFLASTGSATPPAASISVAITSVTNPVNQSNVSNTTVSGTGTVGATISVVVNDALNSSDPLTTTVAANGTWSISGISDLVFAQGTITYTATATLGGSTATSTITTTKDTLAPNVAVTSVTNPVNAANAANATASGTGEANANISLVVTDGVHTTAAANTVVAANGTWSISGINVSSLDDGTITFRATATDLAGNTTTNSRTATKDTVAPTVAITQVTNPVNANSVANATASGTGEANASISLVVSDGVHTTAPFTTTVAAGGTWTISGMNLSALDDGTITYTVTATDAGGNTATNSMTATKDVLAPQVALTIVTNPVNIGNVTNATASGTGEVGAAISLVVSDGVHSTSAFTTTVGAGGNWTVNAMNLSSLDDGTITFTVTATDLAGNTATASLISTKDTLAPQVALTGVTDPVNNENVTDAGASGTGEVGAGISLVVTDGVHSTSAFTTTVGAGGTWAISNMNLSGLDDGTITYMVTATDLAGNTATHGLTATKDTLVVALTLVTNPVNANNVTNASASGTGEVGADISLVVTDGVHNSGPFTTTVGAGGTWAISDMNLSGLDDGTITYMVTSTDTGGNTATASLTATKDVLPPDVDVTDVSDPVNLSNVTHASAAGTGEVGADISLVVTDGVHNTGPFTTTVSAGGTWAISDMNLSGLDDGMISYIATASDAAGNSFTDSTMVVKDTLAPAVGLDEVTDPVNNLNVTNAGATGTGEVGADISVVATDGVHSTIAYMTTVGAGGTWSVSAMNLVGLDDGTITYLVTATDAAGNTASDSLTATKDTLVVALTAVTDPVNADNVTGASASGTGEVGADISVIVTDGVHETIEHMATVGALGTWTVTGMDLSGLDDGTITYVVTSTDTGGNTATDMLTAAKDVLDPALALTDVTDPVNLDNVTNASASGTGEIGAGIQVFVTDGVHSTIVYTTTVGGGGTWILTDMDLSGLDDGTITYMVTATDAAGNTATDSMMAAKDTAIMMMTLTDGGDTESDGSQGGFDDTAYAGAVDSAVEQEEYWSSVA